MHQLAEAGSTAQGRAGEVLIAEARIAARITSLSDQITRDYCDKQLVAGIVLEGARTFGGDLLEAIPMDVDRFWIEASSYTDSTVSSGAVSVGQLDAADVTDRDILIVDDIVDTGRTLRAVLDRIRSMHPRSIRVAALLSKLSRRCVDVRVNYFGFRIPDRFVVGYGLDYAGRFRDLPDIHVLEFEADGETERR